MNWKILLNPFSKFSEVQLLIAGLIFMMINFAVTYFLGFQMDSIFHYGYIGENDPLLKTVFITLKSYLIAIAVLFVLGKIFNKKTRLIDIINTVIIAQIPVLLLILIGEIPFVDRAIMTIAELTKDKTPQIPISDLIILCFFAFFALITIAHGFALLFNGFKTATNIKDVKKILLFAFVVIITITFSQFLV
ncbi:YIP1 family protein [Chryseobacterium echinoideorum]|uniref:YIP1 family protein n=1 Tax=Chryseobacterium echinoideorum TaxID=1549648 RepID=UPI0011848075|nr:YIP1 family protein [Chryseobacterium echinoideorum]